MAVNSNIKIMPARTHRKRDYWKREDDAADDSLDLSQTRRLFERPGSEMVRKLSSLPDQEVDNFVRKFKNEDHRKKRRKLSYRGELEFLGTLICVSLLYAMVVGIYKLFDLSVTCSSFNPEEVEGETQETRENVIRDHWEDSSHSKDCHHWQDYFSKAFLRWMVDGGIHSFWCIMTVSPGLARSFAAKAITAVNITFWIFQVLIWNLNITLPDDFSFEISIILPVVSCQAYAIRKYDRRKGLSWAILAWTVALTSHHFGFLNFLASLVAESTESEYKLLILYLPFHILVVEFLIVRVISYPRVFDSYHPDTAYALAKITVANLETLRLGLLMFTYSEEVATVTILSLFLSSFIEIVTRTRSWLYLLVKLANHLHSLCFPQALHASGKQRPRFRVHARKFFYRAYVNAKYEVEYIPMLAAVFVLLFNWVPIGTVGTVKDQSGHPLSDWFLPAWFFVLVLVSELLADFGSALTSKYFHVDQLEFHRCGGWMTTFSHTAFNLGMAYISLCGMSLVFVLRRVQD